jgi:uncharacterized protein (TIRG00374 family)
VFTVVFHRGLGATLLEARQYRITWKTYVLLLVGLGAFCGYIYLLHVDIQEIITTVVQRIDIHIYIAAAVFAVLNILFFSLSWYSLLNFLKVQVSVAKSFLYVWYGIFIDAIIPGESVSGELSKIYLITRDDSTVSGKVVASLVTQRLIGMGVNVASLLIGISILLSLGQVSGLVLTLTFVLAVAVSAFLVLLALFCVKEKWTLRIVDGGLRLVEWLTRGHWKEQLTKAREELNNAARMFHDSMKEFARAPKTLLASLGFHAISWIFDLIVIYLVFVSIGYTSIHWSMIIVTYSVLVAIKAVPVGIPFEAGLPEIAMSSLFIWMGVPAGISFTVTILSRLLTMWLRFFIGFGVQQSLEIHHAKSPTLNSKIPVQSTKKV